MKLIAHVSRPHFQLRAFSPLHCERNKTGPNVKSKKWRQLEYVMLVK
jgi:hypothetical protein